MPSAPMDNNVQGKQAEKLVKYKVLGAHGTIGKELTKYLEAIPGLE